MEIMDLRTVSLLVWTEVSLLVVTTIFLLVICWYSRKRLRRSIEDQSDMEAMFAKFARDQRSHPKWISVDQIIAAEQQRHAQFILQDPYSDYESSGIWPSAEESIQLTLPSWVQSRYRTTDEHAYPLPSPPSPVSPPPSEIEVHEKLAKHGTNSVDESIATESTSIRLERRRRTPSGMPPSNSTVYCSVSDLDLDWEHQDQERSNTSTSTSSTRSTVEKNIGLSSPEIQAISCEIVSQ